MDTFNMILSLLGGLALFLYGMNMMSTNLEAVAGNRMKKLIDKLTTNPILGVLVGTAITAVIQSSSATTVMVVGFVNSKLMDLKQAVWIIMGANIGTTVTGLLVALDIGMIAPLIAFIGIALIIFFKNKTVRYIGSIVAGLGILFIGMNMMSDAMTPLRENEAFINVMTQFSNPLLGILAGAVFTAIIQSSSASVGILQTLAMSGIIGLGDAVYVLFGMNIGTCITAVLAAIGANRNAKRTTIVHLSFNIIGTIIFTIICLVTPFTSWIEGWFPSSPAGQIAATHTTFNIVTTLLLLPFGSLLAKFATLVLPDSKRDRRKSAADKWFEEIANAQHVLGSSAVAIESIQNDIRKMFALARENVATGFEALIELRPEMTNTMERKEDLIDKYNYEISQKISKMLTVELSDSASMQLNRMFRVIGNIERIGDHAVNFADYSRILSERGIPFSETTVQEIAAMRDSCLKAVDMLADPAAENVEDMLAATYEYEEENDNAVRTARNSAMQRVRDGGEDMECAVLYSEYLSDYERIGDHLLNIAQEYASKPQSKRPDGVTAATVV